MKKCAADSEKQSFKSNKDINKEKKKRRQHFKYHLLHLCIKAFIFNLYLFWVFCST